MNKFLPLCAIVFLFSCSSNEMKSSKKVKNVILMIGDGMGPQQISLLYYFAKYSKLGVLGKDDFAFERLAELGEFGTSATEPYGKIVTDSACSATQLAIGDRSRSEMIGLNKDGSSVKTILEKAIAKGLRTGLVSDTRLTHATPAAFSSHVANRWSEDRIAQQMIEIGPDLMLSSGANRFIPKDEVRKIPGAFTIKSKRGDDKDLLKLAKDKEYQIVFTKKQLEESSDKKILGLFADHDYPSAMWLNQNEHMKNRTVPNLLEMSKVAIKNLKQNKNGYFLMIEGGQIDWAGHRNDAGEMLHNMIAFNKTINWVIDYVKNNPETLLVVTADHETGSFGFSYNIDELPKAIKLSGDEFKEKDFKPFYNYGEYSTLDRLYKQKKSFIQIWDEFKVMNKKDKTASNMKKIIEENTGYKISMEDAKNILKTGKNRYFHEGHPVAGVKEFAYIRDFDSFYYSETNNRTSLIARSLSSQQNIVWGTGGHTATPVHLYSIGPTYLTKKLSGYTNHAKVGEVLQEALGL